MNNIVKPPVPTDTDKLPAQQPELEGSDAEAYAALKAKRAERRRKTIRHRAIAAGIVAALVVGGGITVALMGRSEQNQSMEPITDVATQGTFENSVDAKGKLEPISSTVISPAIDGKIATVNVVAGQHVNEGDVLMTITNPELDAAAADAARALKTAQSDLASAQSALKDAQAAGPSVAPDGTPVPVDLTAAKEAVNQARNAVESARAANDQAQEKLAQKTVKAPSSGNIVALNAQVGANLSDLAASAAGGSAPGPLMQIADLSTMKVTVQVSEEDIAKVAVDQQAKATFPAYPEVELEGKVVSIASIATTDGTSYSYDGSPIPTFAVDVLIENPDPKLKPGMTAEVTLTTQKYDNVVMVPTGALLTDDGSSFYVNVETDAETHEAERHDVTVVAQSDEYAVIGRPKDAPASQNPDMPSSPVKDGDTLVISGGDGGEDGPQAGMELR